MTSDIYAWYELSDVLLCASDMESLPRSIIEAMAFELPVVSTDVYGIADLIDDGKTGWLTRDRDLGALAGLLHVVLQKPDSELKQVAMAAQAIAHGRHGSQSYGRLIAETLKGLLEDPAFDIGSCCLPWKARSTMSDISELEDEIQMLRREREQLGMRLLELQRRAVSASASELDRRARDSGMVEEELRQQIRELQSENAALRGSLAWRPRAPARKAREYLRRRSARQAP